MAKQNIAGRIVGIGDYRPQKKRWFVEYKDELKKYGRGGARRGVAGLGKARHGEAWSGEARQGLFE